MSFSSSDMTMTTRKRKSEVGIRFHPTDEELVGHFLMKKIRGDDNLRIPEIKICDYEPWKLPDLVKKEPNDEAWFFFSPCEYKYKSSPRLNRRTKAGFWKPTGKSREVRKQRTKEVIGTKTCLVFYKQQHPKKPIKTSFVMHEYDNNIAKSKAKSKFRVYKLKVNPEDIADQSDETAVASAFDFSTVNSSCEEISDENYEVSGHITNENMTDDLPMSELISIETCDFEYQYDLEIQNDMNSGNQNLYRKTDLSTPATGFGLQINDSGPICSEVQGPVTFFDEVKALQMVWEESSFNSTLLSPWGQ